MSFSKKLILGSGSPRRKELLALLGLPFEVKPAGANEAQFAGEDPLAYVQRMAGEKGRALAADPESVTLSADTIVVLEAEVIGKPADAAEAEAFLKALRGRDHAVITALQLTEEGTESALTDHCQSTIRMRDYTDDELMAYIETGSPFDKAGGYAIQDEAFHPAAQIQGCWANVMGLPLCHLYKLCTRAGFASKAGIADRCQAYLKISCPVYEEILNEA